MELMRRIKQFHRRATEKIEVSLRSLRYLCVLCVSAVAVFSSCSSKTSSDKQVFTYNEQTGIASLDPAFAKNQSVMWPIHQLYNTLVEVDSNLNIVPSLAKSWEVSDDRLTFTFRLRNDVFFHDDDCFPGKKGRRMTAHDVAYSLGRILHKSTASTGTWIFNNRVDTVKPFMAIDDTTFQLRLIRPFHPIMGILSMQYCSILPREAVEKYGKDFRRHPVGTGPFKMYLWEEGQALVMHKNDRYWEKDEAGISLPYLDAIKITFFDNKATEFLQFRQGDLSFINDIDPSFKDEVLSKKGDLRDEWKDKITLNKHPYLNTEYLGMLVDESSPVLKNSPTKIKALRQAMNHAIDKKKLVMYMRNSIGIPAEAGFVPGGLPSRNTELVKGYEYNPSKARALLQQAGLTSKMPVIKLLTIPIYADIGSFVAKELENAGIPVQVEVIQKSLLLEQTAKSQALFFRGSWIADYPDAENYMAMYYSKNPAPPNYTRYKNKAFDVLYEKALLEINDSVRYELYRQMDQIVINDAPVIPLWYDMVLHIVQKNVTGFKPNALNLLELRRTRILE
jgi:oligopeptide transport system substrate-binding protein